MNVRRLMPDIGLPLTSAPPAGLPQVQPAAQGLESPWDRPESF